jgi:HSP20 family protein
MSVNDPINWMLSEALGSLARAERLHQQFFTLQQTFWEPPIDVLETDEEILIFVALPGVDLDQVEAVIENGVLSISGSRTLPAELRNARIHRLELPQGNFLRRRLAHRALRDQPLCRQWMHRLSPRKIRVEPWQPITKPLPRRARRRQTKSGSPTMP